MNKQGENGIGWCDFTSNPVPGYCPVACPYCYARAIYDRFGWDKTIRFKPEEMNEWRKARSGEKVFVGSTMELFGDWVPDEWMQVILAQVEMRPDVIFQFLTKLPWNLPKFNPWPANAWVGASVTDARYFAEACGYLRDIEASIKYLSIEPYLSEIIGSELDAMLMKMAGIRWLILGGQSGKKKLYPPEEWIQEIEDAAGRAGIPIYEKDNLRKNWIGPPRREFPRS